MTDLYQSLNPLATQYQSGIAFSSQMQYTSISQPTPQKPATGKAHDERRKDPSKIQYRDLQVGDVIQDDDNGATIKIVGIKDGQFSIEINGHIDWWHINDERLAHGNRRLITPAKARPKVTFDDVILPENTKQLIFDAISQRDNHDLIFDEWGFGDVLEKGRAISMLFYGPPGTGKTMIAQAIADKYDMALKVISTAEIESSEPGQAERNIKAFFDAASKDGKTVLLFDECDSLIADRRSVGMILGAQINQLLTSLEHFDGIALFTTNRLEKMDEAFSRRLSLKLKFELPDIEARIKIWQRLFPSKAPLSDDIDWHKIAAVEIAGGYIKNVALRAARRAANSPEKCITHQIIVDALYEEATTMAEFQAAVDSNTTPRMIGPSNDYRKGA